MVWWAVAVASSPIHQSVTEGEEGEPNKPSVLFALSSVTHYKRSYCTFCYSPCYLWFTTPLTSDLPEISFCWYAERERNRQAFDCSALLL